MRAAVHLARRGAIIRVGADRHRDGAQVEVAVDGCRRLQGGRLPEVIARGEPAILVCHWPGIYFNGEKIGFNIFKEVVRRLHARYKTMTARGKPAGVAVTAMARELAGFVWAEMTS